jgi:hypothetical protein
MIFLSVLALLSPFVLVFLFRDAARGFLYGVVSFFSIHFSVSFITQYLNIFEYKNVVLVFLALAAIAFAMMALLGQKMRRPPFDPVVAFVFFCIGLQLWSVHYNYTGPVQTLNGTSYVSSDSYAYPLFSDEWVAGSLSRHVIETGGLPLVNPFVPGSSFVNLLLPFHVFVSQFFLLLQMDPVSDFAVLPIFLGILTCMASYAFLRNYGISRNASLVAVALIPFITQSSSLPGIWFALPYVIGLLCLLAHIVGVSKKDAYLTVFGAIASFLFYPPIIVFLAPVALYFMVTSKRYLMLSLSIALMAGALFFSDVHSRVVRENLDGGILNLPITLIIPILLLPFVCAGLYALLRKRAYELFIPLCVGMSLWAFYAFFSVVVIIEYPRVVSVTSLMLVLSVGFSLRAFDRYLSKRGVAIALGSCLVAVTFWYPVSEKWIFLTLAPSSEHDANFIPAGAPVTRYLLEEDLDIFSSLEGERFIAPPWKGLVLGSATENFPLETKPSTISTRILSYEEFVVSSCARKGEYAALYGIGYFYGPRTDCPGFERVRQSSEKLTLYKLTDVD